MISHRESRIVPYPAALMYRVVADVEKYPEFLPWVVALRVLTRRENGMTAEMAVGYHGLRERYTSDVRLDPEARIEVWKTVKELADNGTTVFLTTQYLDEAEQLADRIAILHEGKIIANGTLDELKKLFPPAKVEYVEKQPTLEEIFLAIIGKKEEK